MPLPSVPPGPKRINCLCPHCNKNFRPNFFDVVPVPNMNPGDTSLAVMCPYCKQHGPLAPNKDKELAILYFVQRHAIDAEHRGIEHK